MSINIRPADISVTDSYRGGGAFNTVFVVHGVGKDDLCPFLSDAMDRKELRFGHVLHMMDSGKAIQASSMQVVERS